MIDAMVNDGDVIMKPQYEARNGDMVAVWLRNDTTTLKHFFNEGHRFSQPANPMEVIYVDPAEVRFKACIDGVAANALRQVIKQEAVILAVSFFVLIRTLFVLKHKNSE
jgi:SOS-response transcriptional repressor LexA